MNIPITAATNFSYWINPSDANGKYASVDFTYRRSDGTTGTFINTGIKDMNGSSTHPNTGHIKTSDPSYSLPLNQWTQVAMNIGGNASLVGKTIIKMTIKFDTTASYNAQGSFSGYIDDIRITNQAVAAAAPTASNISLIGSSNGAVFAGSQLTGSYTYADANGEPEFGSVFEWLSAPTAGGTYTTVSGATYASFTPTASLIGKYIKFKVTPKNVYDLGTGTPVESAPIQIKGFDGTTSFEAGDFPAIVNTVDGNGGRKMSVTNEKAEISSTVAKSGTQSFAVSGTANIRSLPTDGTYVDFLTFNASIPITADTKLSYWIYPTNEISRYIGIDFSASGSSLRDSGAVDKTGAGMHPNKAHKPTGGKDIPLNEWTQIVSDIGSYPNLRGKTIETIKIKFDNPGAVGNFLTYFDDIEITDGALQEQAPTAHTVAVTGDASVGATLGGDYVYRDAFGKPEKGSSYKWLRGNTVNGAFTEIPGATGKTYTLTAAEVGKYVKFEVTPINNAATSSVGSPKQSSTAIGPVIGSNLPPTAPIASEAGISGSKLVGSLVTGSYTYLDPNGDLESGSSYRWLRSDSENGIYTAIANATETTYMLTNEDTDKYLKFEVTPRTDVAPETGAPVLSNSFGPVAQSVQVTASFVAGNGSVATQLMPNQLLTGNAVIVNQNTLAADVLIIVALYDSSGSMVNVSFSQKSIAPGTSEALSAGFKLPSSTAGYRVKLFAAGGTSIYSPLIPLSNVFELR
ncbi:hypothetical protein [Paenibacillus sp. N3.4]|uniref:hypothetical protein n=1 Tax=Paenibacillus sp. N3.4 TaxID=2603222 RepID=UPI001C9C559C|nr:hypothetical protein [Paenibacillus sp. N3.4]